MIPQNNSPTPGPHQPRPGPGLAPWGIAALYLFWFLGLVWAFTGMIGVLLMALLLNAGIDRIARARNPAPWTDENG